jgi:predicted alternative tryptophan synthase beta-subunit
MPVSIILSAEVDGMTKVEGEDVTRLAQEVGSALQRILTESPQMSHCLNRVRAEGYEVSLVLEATIGFSRTEGSEPAPEATFDVRVEKAEPAPLKMTPLDKKFLRSLKITVDEEDD